MLRKAVLALLSGDVIVREHHESGLAALGEWLGGA